MNFLQELLIGIRRQITVVLAISSYDIDRRSTGTSIGAWESILTPLQIMLFFIAVRLGFSFLR